MSILLHPRKDRATDGNIWTALEGYVSKNRGAPQKYVKCLTNFLEVEQKKKEYFPPKKGDPVLTSTERPASAPFAVPTDLADYTIAEGKYYHFRHRGKRFYGKTSGTQNGQTIRFLKDSILLYTGSGNYEREQDGKLVTDHPYFSWKIEAAVAAGSGSSATPAKVLIDRDCVKVLSDELIRPWLHFCRLVDQALELDFSDPQAEKHFQQMLGKLQRLFVNSKLDLRGLPHRFTCLEESKENIEKRRDDAKKEKEMAEWKRKSGAKWRGKHIAGMEYAQGEVVVFTDDKVYVASKNTKLAPNGSTPSEWVEWSGEGRMPMQHSWTLEEIDRWRIELDSRLWNHYKDGEHKRTPPNLYDLFEVLGIDRGMNITDAFVVLSGKLGVRKGKRAYKWDPPHYTYYDNSNVNKTAAWESALVNCLPYYKWASYNADIVRHLVRHPSLHKQLNTIGATESLHSKAFESGDNHLTEDFASSLRHMSDERKLGDIFRMPWPETKALLEKVPPRNRYYPEQYIEARFPESFYLNLKHEHEACHRLRKVGYLLSVSTEKGYPVLLEPSVVTPAAYGTDYRTRALPRIRTLDASVTPTEEVWLPPAESFSGESVSKRRRKNEPTKVLTLASHPLYPKRPDLVFPSPP